MRLLDYLNAVDRRIDAAVARDEFHETQRTLLEQTVRWYRPVFAADPSSNPIALLYLLARAWGREVDNQVEYAGVFCSFYLLSADLLDDVQDEDLDGKPHAATGPAIAVNNAVTLLFLALEALEKCVELEECPIRRSEFWRLFNRVSVAAVSGQHRDLLGTAIEVTPEAVLAMAQAKTSSVAMIAECAALLAQCESELVAGYRHAGECLATLVQIRDDLVDIFGKSSSPDLAAGKVTYPIACFRVSATENERERFEQLVRRLPDSVREIRTLLYDAGVVTSCAERMEELRDAIHQYIAATGNDSGRHRSLLDLVDCIAESVYHPPEIESTIRTFAPHGAWHDQVSAALSVCLTRMSGALQIVRPRIFPWHLPQWAYSPEKQTIFYPDIEGLAEEVLPFQAELLGTDDLEYVAQLMREQVPAVVAHETFHFIRHASNCITSDHWFEEWAVNRLAVAYLQRYDRITLVRALRLAARILARHRHLIDDRVERVLGRCFERRIVAQAGYAMDTQTMAVTSLEMIRRLATQPIDLDLAVQELLTPAVSACGNAAA